MKMRKNIVVIAGVAAAVIAGLLYWFVFTGDEEPVYTPVKTKQTNKLKRGRGSVVTNVSAAVREQIKPLVNNNGRRKKRLAPGGDVADFAHMNPKDRRLSLAVQAALDENDFKSVVSATAAALKSPNPEVRENAVEALGWFGVEALPELTPLMADKNEDVAEAAMNNWQSALSEIEDVDTKAKIAETVMPSLFNTDALEMIVTEITGQDDDLKIMQSLVNLMECGNGKVVSVVKEEYESLTGDTWTGIDAAEAWLQENYEPIED